MSDLVDISELKKELVYLTSRSSGPGGQNVNKLETRVTVQWNVAASTLFSETQQSLLLEKFQDKINQQGYIQTSSQEARSQLENKELAVKKLIQLIKKALFIPKPRKKTKPGKGAVAERLQEKKINAEKKKQRQKPSF